MALQMKFPNLYTFTFYMFESKTYLLFLIGIYIDKVFCKTASDSNTQKTVLNLLQPPRVVTIETLVRHGEICLSVMVIITSGFRKKKTFAIFNSF
jgi:hypothetical protein